MIEPPSHSARAGQSGIPGWPDKAVAAFNLRVARASSAVATSGSGGAASSRRAAALSFGGAPFSRNVAGLSCGGAAFCRNVAALSPPGGRQSRNAAALLGQNCSYRAAASQQFTPPPQLWCRSGAVHQPHGRSSECAVLSHLSSPIAAPNRNAAALCRAGGAAEPHRCSSVATTRHSAADRPGTWRELALQPIFSRPKFASPRAILNHERGLPPMTPRWSLLREAPACAVSRPISA